MAKLPDRSTVVYPALGSSKDLWFARLAGHGLGNCFYTYFHAAVLARRFGAAVIAPPWFSLKLGPLLRGERSKRLYFGLFKPFSGEIHGVDKFLTLARLYPRRTIVKVGDSAEPTLAEGTLNVVVSTRFTFQGLHAHRMLIRERLLGILTDSVPADLRWGSGGYIAMHVRLGDFAPADATTLLTDKPNLRIPLAWYVDLMRVLRKRYPDMPIRVFSDGPASALQPILDAGASLRRTGSDVTDLLAMAGASILVGSNSTYSRWAAFLGNMPSIWLKTAAAVDRPSDPETPIHYVALDAADSAI